MTEIEEKSFKAQLKLLSEIKRSDDMILHYIVSNASHLFRKLDLYGTMDKTIKDDIDISMEDFEEIKNFFRSLGNGISDFESFDKCIKPHVQEKKLKEEILNMLK